MASTGICFFPQHRFIVFRACKESNGTGLYITKRRGVSFQPICVVGKFKKSRVVRRIRAALSNEIRDIGFPRFNHGSLDRRVGIETFAD